MKTCTVEGCSRKHLAKGLCAAHYCQLATHGKFLDPSVMKSPRSAVCKVDGCGITIIKGRGYCERHYQQHKKHGRIISNERLCAVRIGHNMRISAGYVYLYRPDHPCAVMGGYAKRANLVWEENTGHVVEPPEIVHHKNRKRGDDDFGNLELCENKSAHHRLHVDDLRKAKEAACL